jgi:hypothetical protein
MGTINGLFAGGVGYYLDTTVLNLHAAVWLFLLGWVGTTTYLSYKRVPSGVLSVGLYFIALFVFLQPIIAYGSELAAAGQASGTTPAHLMLTSWQGILTWGVLSGVLALTIMFVSRLLNRHAQRVVSRRLKRACGRTRTTDPSDVTAWGSSREEAGSAGGSVLPTARRRGGRASSVSSAIASDSSRRSRRRVIDAL